MLFELSPAPIKPLLAHSRTLHVLVLVEPICKALRGSVTGGVWMMPAMATLGVAITIR